MFNIDTFNFKINELLVLLVESPIYDENILIEKIDEILNLDSSTTFTSVQLNSFLRTVFLTKKFSLDKVNTISNVLLNRYITDVNFKLTYVLIAFILCSSMTEKSFRNNLLSIANDNTLEPITRYTASIYLTNVLMSDNFEVDILFQKNLIKEIGVPC